ncbi:hypothetical protein MSAN_02377700 [Mycena sanguinolenta]|uniref:Uncharacterized protein n=1 Tax=Mycena sanguinolenta TaxID=230812 RepID=A0A8H7CE72_9AGAR|nr:hypothetical protein MSAN_02377700 [Mycena sanguinolenta]
MQLRDGLGRAGRETFGAVHASVQGVYCISCVMQSAVIVRAAMCIAFEAAEIVADKPSSASSSMTKNGCAPSATGSASSTAMQVQRLKATSDGEFLYHELTYPLVAGPQNPSWIFGNVKELGRETGLTKGGKKNSTPFICFGVYSIGDSYVADAKALSYIVANDSRLLGEG